MPALPIFIASLILIIGILTRVTRRELPLQTKTPDALSESVKAPTVTPFLHSSLPSSGQAGQAPTPTNSPTVSEHYSGTLQLFVYPNSRVIASTDTSRSLESSDGPDAITSWYKEKIMERGMTSRSFVQTKTNGNVLNALVATGNGQKISITIKSRQPLSTVSIDVSLQTY